MGASYPRLSDERLAQLPDVVRDIVETDRQMDALLAPKVIPLDQFVRKEFGRLKARRHENRTSARAKFSPQADNE